MKIAPRVLGVALILALLNIGYVSVALATKTKARQVVAASDVSTFATKSLNEPLPEPTPTHATKADLKQDLDKTKSDLQAIIGDDPNGFAAKLLRDAGFDPLEDIDDATTDLENISEEDFEKGQSHFDKLHRKFQKRQNNMAAILKNPTLMAMLQRPSPLKFRVVTGNSEASTTETNRAFLLSKSGSESTRYSKDLSNLRVVVMPELTKTCSPGNGVSTDPVNVLTIAKALTLGTEIIKEGIPEDTMVVPHSIAVVAWGAAKTAEFILDTLHQIYVECNAVRANAATDLALDNIGSNVSSIKTTVGGTNTLINTVSTKVDTINNTANNVKTVVTNIDNSVTNIASQITNITNTVNTTSNNVNTANTNITAAQNSINTFSELSLRLMIEADLAAADNSTPVALFETPGVKGGYLEMVRTIVAATITNLAGSSAGQANSFLAQGDAYKAAGNYKAAYAAYRKAYKSAAN